jgi:hypothetical protein
MSETGIEVEIIRYSLPLLLATALLFVASSTATGHQHDYGVKLQLVESISTAAANAASIAREIGSGEIVHEATSPQSAAAVIQQRSESSIARLGAGD